MYIKADKKFGSEVYEYDVVVLPGGRPGGANLLANPDVIKLVQDFNTTEGKYIGAMCSGTVVLSEAKVIDGKDVTGYTGYAEKLIGGNFKEDVVVFDQKILLQAKDQLLHIHSHIKSLKYSVKIRLY